MTNSTNSTSTVVYNTTCPCCGEPLMINKTTYEKKCPKCGYHEVTTVGTNPFSLSNIPAAEDALQEHDNKPGGSLRLDLSEMWCCYESLYIFLSKLYST